MVRHESVGREVVKGVGLFVGHVGAVVLGLVLIIVGIGLGVGLVTLPFAIPVGFAGLFIFLWGVLGRAEQTQSATGPPPPAAPPPKPGAPQ
jgi:hypothetical protein